MLLNYKMLALGLVAASLLVSGCSVQKTMSATGGSKADGTIEMSYEYGNFEKPVVNRTQADRRATERCKAWGYDHADAFGGGKTQCLTANAYGCTYQRVTVTYQCLD